MKKRTHFLSFVVTAILAFTGLFNAAQANDLKVAILLPGNITDKSWSQAGYEGLVKAKQELGIEFTYSESVHQPDQVEAMTDYARSGYDVIIGHGGEFQEAISRVAKRFPDTLFLSNMSEKAGGNVAAITFKFRQLGTLLGHVAGRMSETKVAGFIGAERIKFATELQAGYEEGFMSVHPEGQVLTAWTGDWADVAKGKEAALNQISQGADMIFPTMDNAVVGSLQAAQEKSVSGFGLWYDAASDWPNTVKQSAIFDISEAMIDFLKAAAEGKAEGKVYRFGVESEAAAYLGSYHSSVPADVKHEVDALIEQLKAGSS